MPLDYVCEDCNKSFELVLTLSEHDKDNIKFPKCGSKKVEQESGGVLRGNVEEELITGIDYGK